VSPAALAVLALVVTLVLSATTRLNVGLLSIAFAWLIGVYAAGLKPDAVIGGFPSSLFLTLAGVTLLFGIASANATLDLLAHRATSLVRGNAGLVAPLFFVLAGLVSSVGPGAIASVALVAPIAMATGARVGLSPLLTAVCVATGANAGNLSPVSSVGATVNSLMEKSGVGAHPGKVWAANLLAHVVVAAAAWLAFGGWRALRLGTRAEIVADSTPLDRRHWITIAVTVVWMAAVIIGRVNVGLAAFAAATALVLLRAADEAEAIRRIPLDVILMVTGVSMLIGVLETTGGLDLFSGMLARLASPATLNAVIAFVTGVISTYSSTSGVVLPAFLPMVPALVRDVGGGDPLAVALSINVGASIVDVSPLSTLGALCIAAIADRAQARTLFRQLLIWGLSMTLVGAALAGLFATPFARL
jgi:di/tricarboxylate transporter